MHIRNEDRLRKGAFALVFTLVVLGMTWVVASWLDPDFGWRLRYGQLILSGGFPSGDPFSYTVPGFPFVSHAWLFDVSIAWLYPHVGSIGLSVIMAALIALSLTLVTRALSGTWTRVMVMLMAPAMLIPFSGVRAQVAAWPLAALAYVLATLPGKKWDRARYAVPFIALFWANVHGSLPLLFVFVGARVLADIIVSRKVSAINLLILLISVGCTLVNPYGIELWREIARTTFDTSLRGSVVEWRSPFVSISLYPFLGAVALFPLCCAVLILDRTRERLVRILLFAITSGMAVFYARHVALWLFCALGCLASVRGQYRNAFVLILRDPGFRILRIPVAVLFSLLLIMPYSHAELVHGTNLAERRLEPYPVKAVAWMHTHPVPHQLFSGYNYGGYLIWQNPDYKVFMDGRMPSWKWNAPAGQSSDPYLEWKNISRGDQRAFEEAAATYGIRSALYSTDSDGAAFAKIMQNLKWEKVYSDEKTAIWVAPTS